MRTDVVFTNPHEFISISDYDTILSVKGVRWFAEILRRIPSLQVEDKLCQEDWGVVIFAERNKNRFQIGISFWPEGEHAWLVHFRHPSFAWLQHWSVSGKAELNRLILDLHAVLKIEPTVTKISWYEEREMNQPNPNASGQPN